MAIMQHVDNFEVSRSVRNKGLIASTNNIVKLPRTELNIKLSNYFKEKYKNFNGIIDEEYVADAIDNLNNYLKANHPSEHLLTKPTYNQDGLMFFVPITNNLKLEVLVVDEYFESGNYCIYMDVSFFHINENTNTSDVDALITFIKKHLKF